MLPTWLSPLPLVAILRGMRPEEAVATGDVLVKAGFHVLEVPLNSPQALDSIRLLSEAFGEHCTIGAGTVMSASAVTEVAAAGGRLIVMPHADPVVIGAAVRAGLACVPGVATPSEAFTAVRAGACALKAFPAEQVTPEVLRAWRAVLPGDIAVLPVGGITPQRMQVYRDAGAAGFGIGSALYAPGRAITQIAETAADFVRAWHSISMDTQNS